MHFYIGLLGFVLYFIYDINQIFHIHKVCKSFFTIGSLLIIFATVSCMSFEIMNGWGLLFFVLGIVFEIYVLFFALNFNDTYVDDQFHVCDRGVYALCRHPGFYSFLLIYVGLYIMYHTRFTFWILIIYNLFNFLYIVFQDVYVFPKLFDEYKEYKKTTPFLLFNAKSLNKCIKDFRGLK